MKPHDLIRHSFQALEPSEGFEGKVLEAAQHTKKSPRILPRTLIAAAVVVCLIVSVAAVGYTAGWLDRWLDTNSDVNYFKTNTLYPDIEGTADGLTVTLDKFLCDGPFVYFQVTMRSEEEIKTSYYDNVMTCVSYPEFIPYVDPQTGKQALDFGPSSSCADQRLDDGSDPRVRTYAIRVSLRMLESYTGDTLILSLGKIPSAEEVEAAFPHGVAVEELLTYEFTFENKNYREAKLENGTQIRINSLGVGIQGYEFFGWADENGNYKEGTLDATVCGVILKDGTRLNFLTSTLGYDERCSSEEYWNNSPLPEVIDPEDVVAIFSEDTVYPLQ